MDDNAYHRHMEYIHYNPVKHGLVNEVISRQYSIFHRYVKIAIYPQDWGGGMIATSENFYGE